ncbi:CDP-diacylglycerol synthase [Heterostelium album PN500]|uniref:Phosphatidate cytidylyltransferase n=1 Tax=Heterostelium pallidum (strain ATCC 26659 / Pp 5 / PN500) TaxID=670386 RepID=D3B5U9_HETP5|nr:CDP-diacylglycerol synthase [Heterostelium album PN500]EFA83247.1 CDP-diacylglycerol synthase [Heterostelium album PN500]|eukprot:XP_020435364.1 CDP-diacylglycerol synthase [Heterostelium album PN500]
MDTTTRNRMNGNKKKKEDEVVSPSIGSPGLVNKALSKASSRDDFDSSKDETSSDDDSQAVANATNNADNAKPTDPPESKYKKLAVRSVIGAMMIAFFTLILSTDHFIVSLFVIALQLLVFKEMVSLRYIEAKEKKIPRFRTLAWFFLLSAFFFFYAKPILVKLATYYPDIFQHFVHYHLWHSFSLYCIGFVSFIFTLRKGVYRYQFSQFTWILMILMMVVVQSNFIISNIYQGFIWFILPVAIIVCNDIFAYFNGFFLGKKFIQKPLMKISPNKTWEGFIGATIWTLVFAYYFAGFLTQFQWCICPKGSSGFMETLTCVPDPVFVEKDYVLPVEVSAFLSKYIGIQMTHFSYVPIQYHALVLALFGSLIAPFGGFFASGIKRAYKIKDFDNIFPGHGGVTDRTDCQFIMGLFIHVYYLTFIKTNDLDANQIWQGLLMLPIDQQVQIYQKLQTTIESVLIKA